MGWYYSSATKQQVIDHILDQFTLANSEVVMTAKTDFGRKLWVVSRNPRYNNNKSWITLFLLASHDGMWGYKDIDEDMGPYHIAPLKVLEAVDPTNNERAAKYRQDCVMYHMKQRVLKRQRRNQLAEDYFVNQGIHARETLKIRYKSEFKDLLYQVEKGNYEPLSSEVWDVIQNEGYDDELELYNPDLFEYIVLTIPSEDKEALKAFKSEALEKYNRFDIELKEKFKNHIDLINYKNGVVSVVKIKQ